MSNARVLIALVVAGVLVLAAVFVLRRPSAASDGAAPLLQFDPAHAVSLTVTRSAKESESVRRGSGAEWVVTLKTGSGEATDWPANASNVRSAFTVLSRVMPVRAGDSASMPEGGTLVSVGLDDGRTVSMRLDSSVLAGAVLAQAESPKKGRPVWIESSLADMLVKSGPREWRSTVALPGVGESARITIANKTMTIGLARVQGRWYLREPVAEAAEGEQVARLADALARVQITDFLDGGAPAQTGLEAPLAIVTLEQDQRDPATGQSQTLKTSLRIGQPADMAAKGVFAAVTRPGAPERIMVISAQPLEALPADASVYVSRAAVSRPAADVGVVRVGSHRFERTLNGWSSGGAPVVPEDAAAVTELIAVLTEAKADKVVISPASGAKTVAVEVEGLSGDSIGKLTLRASEEAGPGGARALVVGSGRVERSYSGKCSERIAGLMERDGN